MYSAPSSRTPTTTPASDMDINELSSISQDLTDLRAIEHVHRAIMAVFSVVLLGIAVARLLRHK
jgi:hypothetical protein